MTVNNISRKFAGYITNGRYDQFHSPSHNDYEHTWKVESRERRSMGVLLLNQAAYIGSSTRSSGSSWADG
jgi:hypothetical protein